MDFFILKGQHESYPLVGNGILPKIAKSLSGVEYEIQLNETMRYDLVDEDQSDWNKLCGITFIKPDNKDTALLLGWRYKKEDDFVEIAPYIHYRYETFYPEKEVALRILRFKPTDKLKVRIFYKGTLKGYYVQNELGDWELFGLIQDYFNYNKLLVWQINTSFGGNERSPKTIKINYSFNWLKK